jgi:cytochrome b subunit of formate dehydrogenase
MNAEPSTTTGNHPSYWRICCGLLLLLMTVMSGWAGAVEIPAAQIENRRCLNCHGQQRMAELSTNDRRSMVHASTTRPNAGTAESAARPGLYVSPTALVGSVHAEQACVSCHADAADLPHAQHLATPSCVTGCHTGAGSAMLQGAHADAAARQDGRAPTCATCHGGHDIRRKQDRLSRTYPLNIVKICGECHQKHQTVSAPGGKTRVQNYLESVHGKAVEGGLVVAATCADCHGNHRVLPAADSRSSVNRQQVAQTCGQCHAGVAETFKGSIHGQKAADGDTRAPVCTSCHTGHEISRTDTPAFKLDIVNECGECHEKSDMVTTRKTSLYDTYRRSYHGQVTQLGSTRAARCSDCHGSHDILPVTDPASRLHGANRVQTCRQCHSDASAGFARFEAHADHRDARRYPVLHAVWLYFVVMMSFSFGFFGLHCIFWMIRSMIERIKHGPHPRHVAGAHAIQRFNRVDRINHAFVIISFFGLALTGLPLLYSDKGWAKVLAGMFGGVRSAGICHRVFAVILILNFVVHGVGLVRRIRKYSLRQMLFGPTTMMMRPSDLKDVLAMYRWFFRGGKKPTFDRWTYWEKFDYMAEVGGSGIIGLSGLLLWFPEFFSRFLPGWIFNVATIVHGYEALLAICFIFTIHFFNAHLRLEKFPVDDVMFTGRLPEEEFKEERGVEYARLLASGELEKLRVAPAPRWYRIVAVIMGVLAMVIGTTIAALIILAGLGVL